MTAAPDRRTRRDRVLSVLDVAYETDSTDDVWLRKVLVKAAPLLDDGTGVQGFFCNLHGGGEAVTTPALVGGEPEWHECWRAHWWDEIMTKVPRETMEAMVRFGTVSYAGQMFAALANRIETFAELLTRLEERGYRHALAREHRMRAESKLFYPDSLNVAGVDVTGIGVALVANRRAPVERPLRGHERAQLSRLAGHLGAAVRMRRRLAGGRALTEGAEGIARADGKVLHAEGAATTRAGLAALREAARSVARARSHVEDPLSHWQALHAGRWTVVERFESDGRRILVARENRASHATTAQELTQRERDVLAELAMGLSNKEIGYRLGIAPSTVSGHVQSIARKLGERDSRELIRLARALAERGELDG